MERCRTGVPLRFDASQRMNECYGDHKSSVRSDYRESITSAILP